MSRAVIEARLEGAAKVAAEARKISKALSQSQKDTGDVIKSKVDQATAGVQSFGSKVDAVRTAISPTALLGSVLGGAVLMGLSKATAYLSESTDKAKSFQERTSQTARRAGLDVDLLRSTITRNERTTTQSADSQAEFVEQLQRVTYQGKGAAESLRGMSALATSWGRDVRDLVPVAAAFQDGLRIKGDITPEIERVIASAERLKTIGGPQAMLDTMGALRPVLGQIAMESDLARHKVEALVGILSQKRTSEQAQSVMGGAVGMLRGMINQVEYTLGRRITNDEGQLTNPTKDLQDLQREINKRFRGQDQRVKRRAVLEQFGPDLGSMLLYQDLSKIDSEAGKLDRANIDKGMKDFFQTPEGQRQLRESREQTRDRKVGATTLRASDAVGAAKDVAAEKVIDAGADLGPGYDTGNAPPKFSDFRGAFADGGGGAGEVAIKDRDQFAEKIAQGLAKALREQPLKATLATVTSNPNADKGN